MTAPEKRLEAVEDRLSAKERARLILQAWVRGEASDSRLRKYCPPEDCEEMEAWIERVEHGNEQIMTPLVFNQEWTVQLDHDLGWLTTMARLKERQATLERALEAEGYDVREQVPGRNKPRVRSGRKLLVLPPLDPVVHGHRRGMKRLWGSGNGDPPDPLAFHDLQEGLAESVLAGLRMRWQELEAMERAFAELADDFGGATMVHADIRQGLDEWRAKLFEIRAGLEALVGPIELLPCSEEQFEIFRGHLPERPAARSGGKR